MKPAPFEYERPASVAACIRALVAAGGDGKILAGGQSLAPVLAMRLARPSVVIDINRIPGLSSLTRHEEGISLGTLVRHADLIQQPYSPLLAEAARWIGHPAIRSRGTIGGAIAHSDPAAEWPVVAAALEATLTIAGPERNRKVMATEFFLGPLEPALGADEMLVRIDMSIPETWGFAELSRRHGDFGLVTVVAAVVAGAWRIAIGGIAGVPLRATEAEHSLNATTSTVAVRDAARAAAAAVDPSDDLHASGAYRRAMVEEFVSRAITQALGRTKLGVC